MQGERAALQWQQEEAVGPLDGLPHQHREQDEAQHRKQAVQRTGEEACHIGATSITIVEGAGDPLRDAQPVRSMVPGMCGKQGKGRQV